MKQSSSARHASGVTPATSSMTGSPQAASAPVTTSAATDSSRVDYGRSIAGTTATNILNMVLGLVCASVLARTLGPEGRGAYAAILALPMALAVVAGFGFTNSILLEAARRPEELGSAFITAQLATLLLFIPAGVAGWIAMPSLLKSQESSTIEAARWFLILSVPAMGAFNLSAAALQGARAFRAWNCLRIGQMVLWPVLLVGSVALGHRNARLYSLLMAASYWLMIPAMLVSLVKRSPLPWRIAPHVARRMLPYGMSAWTALLPMQLNRRVDQMAMAAAVSPAILGLYAAGVTISSIVVMMVGPVANVVAPLVAAAGNDEQPRIFGRFGRVSVIAGVAFGVGASAAAPFAILILFGRSFAPAILPTVVLILAGSVEGVARVLGDALMALGRPSRVLRAELVGLVVMGPGLWLSLPRYALVGTALTCLASRTATLIVTAEQISRVLAMRRRDFLLPSFSDMAEFLTRAMAFVPFLGRLGQLHRQGADRNHDK